MSFIEEDFDKKEVLIYEKHSKTDQMIFNDREAGVYDVDKHPEWQDFIQEMQYLLQASLEDFSVQLVG